MTTEKLLEELKSLQAYQEPTERRYKTNDSSIEKIVELLEQNPNGLLYYRDELIGLFKRMERTGNEQDRAFLLESWNGDGSHTDDRIPCAGHICNVSYKGRNMNICSITGTKDSLFAEWDQQCIDFLLCLVIHNRFRKLLDFMFLQVQVQPP